VSDVIDLPSEPLGAHPRPGGTRFALFTTTARHCQVRLFDQAGTVLEEHALAALGEGMFAATVAGCGPGALYQFVLDGRELPDPHARFLPRGVHGPAMVIEPRHRWQHGEGVYRPLAEQVLYELHVGTFTDEGTFTAARARLSELARLGITGIELMPVAAFAGARGWGYDGVAPYAPHASYGTPDELRAFVDAAHGLGLSVFLDVVYNHLGPAGNYLAAYSPGLFTGAIRNAWGDAPDFAHPVMRRHVLDNARYWLGEFRCDGLRLDATHAIIDPSPRHILGELADLVARLRPRKLLIAEDERNDPGCIEALGMDALWADDFHHTVRVTLTGERDGYYAAYRPGTDAIAETVRGGWQYRGQLYPPWQAPRGKGASALPAEAFVYCIQNHDQIGNRALGERLCHQVPLPAYAAVSTLLLFLPMTPLLFMGQEWAASSPFQYFTDHEPELGRLVAEGRRSEFQQFAAFSGPEARARIPDPQDEQTFLRSRLCWRERDEQPHAGMLALYRALLVLRRSDPVLRRADRDRLSLAAAGPLLAAQRSTEAEDRLLVCNFSAEPQPWRALRPDVAGRPVLLASDGATALGEELAPWQAVILGPVPG
jgi:maltooligosyltrehalose trehalohydrolase